MNKDDLQKAIMILKAHKNAPQCVIKKLQEIIDDKENGYEINLIDRNHYFATILWQEEDIRNELKEQGYKASDENIAKVMEYLDTNEMENCEHGWECIYNAIYKAEKKNSLI